MQFEVKPLVAGSEYTKILGQLQDMTVAREKAEASAAERLKAIQTVQRQRDDIKWAYDLLGGLLLKTQRQNREMLAEAMTWRDRYRVSEDIVRSKNKEILELGEEIDRLNDELERLDGIRECVYQNANHVASIADESRNKWRNAAIAGWLSWLVALGCLIAK